MSKERALADIGNMPLDTPSFTLLSLLGSDKPWTPGQWRKNAESSDESPEELCAKKLSYLNKFSQHITQLGEDCQYIR